MTDPKGDIVWDDEAVLDAETVTKILEGIPGFLESLRESEEQYRAGNFIDLEELTDSRS